MSMTGFASQSSELELDGINHVWTWESRSVNGKSLDLRLRLPSGFSELDQALRKAASGRLARGNVQISLTMETRHQDGSFCVNEDFLAVALALSDRLVQERSLAPASVDGLLSVKGMIDAVADDAETSETKAALTKALIDDFETVLDSLVHSRRAEGEALAGILARIIDEIEDHVTQADEAPERKPDVIRQKLTDQIADLRDIDQDLSPDRLHQEALLLAAKADIQEEIDRLKAHVQTARDLLATAEPIGRRLDFLSQELNREANTVCSKANDIAVTNIGLALKAAIDQFREQVQNVE